MSETSQKFPHPKVYILSPQSLIGEHYTSIMVIYILTVCGHGFRIWIIQAYVWINTICKLQKYVWKKYYMHYTKKCEKNTLKSWGGKNKDKRRIYCEFMCFIHHPPLSQTKLNTFLFGYLLVSLAVDGQYVIPDVSFTLVIYGDWMLAPATL